LEKNDSLAWSWLAGRKPSKPQGNQASKPSEPGGISLACLFSARLAKGPFGNQASKPSEPGGISLACLFSAHLAKGPFGKQASKPSEPRGVSLACLFPEGISLACAKQASKQATNKTSQLETKILWITRLRF